MVDKSIWMVEEFFNSFCTFDDLIEAFRVDDAARIKSGKSSLKTNYKPVDLSVEEP